MAVERVPVCQGELTMSWLCGWHSAPLDRFPSHANFEAFFEAAVLTLIAVVLVNGTVPVGTTSVAEIPPYTPLEETLATLAGKLAIMFATRLVPTNHTLNVLLLLLLVSLALLARRVGLGRRAGGAAGARGLRGVRGPGRGSLHRRRLRRLRSLSSGHIVLGVSPRTDYHCHIYGTPLPNFLFPLYFQSLFALLFRSALQQSFSLLFFFSPPPLSLSLSSPLSLLLFCPLFLSFFLLFPWLFFSGGSGRGGSPGTGGGAEARGDGGVCAGGRVASRLSGLQESEVKGGSGGVWGGGEGERGRERERGGKKKKKSLQRSPSLSLRADLQQSS